MSWYEYFAKSNVALQLEESLQGKFKLIEDDNGLASTAHTDVNSTTLTIRLDTTQPPLKCALGYVYELKNLDNASKYKCLIDQAKRQNILKSVFVKEMINIEAEAAYFRCEVFSSLGDQAEDFPCNKDYLRIFNETKHLQQSEIIKRFAQFIMENATVRRQFSAKKYYADSFDYYAGKIAFPTFYDRKPSTDVVINDGTHSFAPAKECKMS